MTADKADIGTEEMSYNPATRTFVTEASQFRSGLQPTLGVRSRRTGRVVLFRFVRIERDAEGDITSWRYVSTDADLPAGGLMLTIFND